jgi:hypothetical protein
MRMALFFAVLIACAPTLAQTQAQTQNFSGTYTTKNPQGGTVTLTLKQDAKKAVTGTLTGNNNTFDVKAQATPDGLLGQVTTNTGATLWILAELQGTQLNVVLAEPGPNGRPNLEAARRLTLAKSGAKPAAPQASGAPKSDQLSQFLTANAWCGFTYNQRTGTSTTERVVFHGNGLVEQRSGAQTYNSGPAGSVAGQHGGGKQGRWKVENGQLHLSEDGLNWAPQVMQVTYNSNGSPIIKSAGKEYMVCR